MSSNPKYSVVMKDVSKIYEIRDGIDRIDSKFWKESAVASAVKKRKLLGGRGMHVTAVKNITFALRAGESVGVLGKNGSGKSTLLRLMSGGESPSTGEVLTTNRPTLLGVSAALQQHLSGSQNIRLGCFAMGMTPEEVDDVYDDIVNFAELGEDIHRPMSTYSSGMGARLTFAISTAKKPEILLVDEALSTGDASFAVKAKARMKGLLDDAGTVVIVSHNATQVKELCDRAIWLHEGEIVADGDVDLISKDYAKWAMRIGRGDFEGANSVLNGHKSDYEKPNIEFV